MDKDVQKAIQAALTRDWKEAVRLNLLILKQNPKDIDSLNRLGRAYFELGLKTRAEEIYNKVLRLDKFNSIAVKSVELVKASRIVHDGHAKPTDMVTPPPVFLEEPGITKTVTLIRLGDPKITSRLHPGDPVYLTPRDHCVSVISQSSQYLGRLPDDLASRLLPLLKAGNKYYAWIRSLDGLKIFIKEIYRSAKFKNTPSFPLTEKLAYAAFTPPELVHLEKPNTAGTEEQEEIMALEHEIDGEEPLSEPSEDL